ncbi:peptidoglycan/LPS O-acetylase OafA/YrhL [Stackebrandtia albiflava]|uniref:Peptidoglycan/LPS O-acetylase OafA/YrhL n=1 Tax=Stackebrandtia albiflava TaxID=406432 RepID=A0A562UL99_9ACTN|nr:acyltransferase family protein [Stackebrandtia albiflava]TWJ06401.1 peptidoglycan/LPS O-acetylase OafA/YrhL [Stackebrandtia albiflava]
MSASLATTAPETVTTPAAPTTGGAFSFRPDIEGLRAVAVGAVVLGHAGVPLVGGGYVGVDVFFVISGFLITSLLLKERTAKGTISIAAFYARRATRLLPAATVVVAATLAGAWLWLPATRYPSIAFDALASAVYGVNFRLAAEGTDYLNAESPPSPLQHFWSLAVEEQFYLVWPLLLIVATLAWRRRRDFGRAPIVVVLALVIAGSLAVSVLYTADSGPWAYFGIHTRAWELAAGAVVAVFATGLSAMNGRAAAVLTWAGLGGIVATVFWFDESTVFPGYAAILPVAGTVAVIAGGCARPTGGAGLLLDRGPLQFVGRTSYGFYLWHWPILLIAPVALGASPSVPLNLLLSLVALLISIGSLHLVENPVRRRMTLKRAPSWGIGVGVSLTGVTALVAVVTLAFPPALSGSGVAPDTATLVAESDSKAETLTALIEESLTVSTVPANLTPALDEADADRPVIYDDGCHAEREVVTAQSGCVYGDEDGDKTVVLMGDSHAAQWFPALNLIAEQQGWRLLPRTKSSCSAPAILPYNSILKRDYHECVQWRDDTIAEIADMEPDMVIMSSSDADNNQPQEESDPDTAWAAGWFETYAQVMSPDTRLVNILDTPWAKTDAPDCLAADIHRVQDCSQPLADAIRQPERRQMSIEVLEPFVDTIIDPSSWLCTDTCPVIVGNLLVYRDGHHITTDYALMLAPLLSERLPRI